MASNDWPVQTHPAQGCEHPNTPSTYKELLRWITMARFGNFLLIKVWPIYGLQARGSTKTALRLGCAVRTWRQQIRAEPHSGHATATGALSDMCPFVYCGEGWLHNLRMDGGRRRFSCRFVGAFSTFFDVYRLIQCQIRVHYCLCRWWE